MIRQDWSSLKKLLFMKAAAGGGSAAVERTATGNPLNFVTDLARPPKSLLIPFTPIQQGSGDPSPQNIRPILPWDGLTVYQSGADTSNPTETDIVFTSPVYGGTLDVVSGVLTVEWEIVDMGSLRWIANATSTTGIYRMSTSSLSDNIEVPSANSVPGKIVCSAYKTVSADGTYSKVGGVAIGRNKAVTVYDADYNTDESVEDFITSVTGKTIAYKLETPVEIQLTPEQITALKGENTIWSDADGSMTCVYLVSSKYAEDHPVGGLSSGLGSGLLGSDPEQDEPIEDTEEEPGEEQPGYTENL